MKRLFRFKRQEEETFQGYCTRTARTARMIWTKMKRSLSSETVVESMWRAMGWTCHTKAKSLRYAFAWKSTAWGQNTKASNVKVIPTITRDASTNLYGTIDVVCGIRWLRSGQERRTGGQAFSVLSVKHSVAHRPKIGECVESDKERKDPRMLRPPDESISNGAEGTTVKYKEN